MPDLFKPEDFSGLRFNIHRHKKDANLLEKEPHLLQFDSFAATVTRPDRDQLIRYVIYMYDKESPFVKTYTDVKVRKREAAIYAGYDPTTEQVKDIFSFTDKMVYPMVSDLCKHIGDRYWNLIILNEQTLLEYEETILSHVIDVKDDKNRLDAVSIKDKLLNSCDEIVLRLEGYYKKVFFDPEVSERVRKNTISPEAYAVKK